MAFLAGNKSYYPETVLAQCKLECSGKSFGGRQVDSRRQAVSATYDHAQLAGFRPAMGLGGGQAQITLLTPTGRSAAIMDYVKCRYEERKKSGKPEKRPVIVQVKEGKLSPKAEGHD